MKEAKNDFNSLMVGNSLSNRGQAQICFIPLALIGAEKIGGDLQRPPPPQPIKVRKGYQRFRVKHKINTPSYFQISESLSFVLDRHFLGKHQIRAEYQSRVIYILSCKT